MSFLSSQLAGSHQEKIVETLKRRRVVPPEGRAADLLALFDAQLGEIGWHSTHVDSQIDHVSKNHSDRIIALVSRLDTHQPRILELGAYAHHSAQLAATALSGIAVSHDISAKSLLVGQARARQLGVCGEAIAVAGDFHNLPFEDDAFDLTFIASAVHHTWRPWQVMQEMIRVTRPGGIIHLENEPVGRVACLYQFRGHRPGDLTPFEACLANAGLLHTILSPFPGSRDEKLFGIVENDRICLEVYEKYLLNAGAVLEWKLDADALINDFERWLLNEKPDAAAIADVLHKGIRSAEKLFSEVDTACGFSVPLDDQIWPLAYRVEAELASMIVGDSRAVARLFGAALSATIIKDGSAPRSQRMFIRDLREKDGVLIDDAAAQARQVDFVNILPDPSQGNFGPDWYVMLEDNGFHTLANLRANCEFPFEFDEGFLILRVYSVSVTKPYHFSIIRNGELVYSHGVARSESHLSKVFVRRGNRVSVHHHDSEGNPLELQFHTRLLPQFVPTS